MSEQHSESSSEVEPVIPEGILVSEPDLSSQDGLLTASEGPEDDGEALDPDTDDGDPEDDE